MPIHGVDYAWSRPGVAALYAAGKRFACRYVSYDTTGKNLTPAEAQSLSAGGLSIVANWENSSVDQLGGYPAGRQHALAALRMARACGMPEGRPIYFSCDFNVTDAQLSTVEEYWRGAASVLGAALVGVYGGLRAIRAAQRSPHVHWYWQTYAWSGGVWAPGVHMRQTLNGASIGGQDIDLDEADANDYGQWTYAGNGGAVTGYAASQPEWADDDVYRGSAFAHGAEKIEGGRWAGEEFWPVKTLKAVSDAVALLPSMVERLDAIEAKLGSAEGGAPGIEEIRAVVDEELDEQSRAGADDDTQDVPPLEPQPEPSTEDTDAPSGGGVV